MHGDYGLLINLSVSLALSVVTIVCGELVPKVFALRNKEWVRLRLSSAMRWFAFYVWPAVWLLERIVTAFMNWGERRWQFAGDGRLPDRRPLSPMTRKQASRSDHQPPAISTGRTNTGPRPRLP